MRIALFSVALILGLSAAYGRTIDEVIRDAYKKGTQTHAANTVLVDMDMLYSREDYEEIISGKDSRKGIRGEQYRWTNKVMPYTLSSVFTTSERAKIRAGMDEWEKYTCMKMVARSGQTNYVHIQDDGSGCNSYVGMRSWGQQPMNLAQWGCIYHATIVHEIGHAIGFEHEHQRPERDSYVQIQWNNVGQGWEFAFDKYSTTHIDDRGVGYDYLSVMHYGKTAFSHNNRDVTIKTIDSKYQDLIGNSPGLVFSDIKLANNFYKCDEHCTNKPTCSDGGFVGKDCKCWCDSGNWNAPICECGTAGCDGGTDPTCLDKDLECSDWAAAGECENNPDYMLYNCEKSCRICGENADCKNYAADCDYWSTIGYCTSSEYEDYMSRYCRKSCKHC